MADVRPGHNNSKKISELRQRSYITAYQQNSWLPLAQYNSRTGSYHNIAINLAAITSYVIENAAAYSSYWTDTWRTYDSYNYVPQTWLDLKNVGDAAELGEAPQKYEEIGEAVSYSTIASNIVSYTFSYTVDYVGWQYFLGRAGDIETNIQYLYTELGNYLLTNDGRKIII